MVKKGNKFKIVAKSWRQTDKAKKLFKIVKPSGRSWRAYSELRALQHAILDENAAAAAEAAEAYDSFCAAIWKEENGDEFSPLGVALIVQREVRKVDYWEWD